MKYNRMHFFSFKSYKCKKNKRKTRKKIVLGVLIIILVAMFLGGYSRKSSEKAAKTADVKMKEQDETNNNEEVKQLCLKIADAYKEIAVKARQSSVERGIDQKRLSQDAIDEIEMYLIKQGYAIINSDKKYPSYLENTDDFYEFWKWVCEKKDAQVKVFRITETGGLVCLYFQFVKGERDYTMINIEWDENDEPYFESVEYRQVIDWEMSENDNFYFQVYKEDKSIDTYVVIKLKPMNEALYDLTEKYLLPIGYLSNNMFLCDWSSEDYGELCFNDLFEYFYKLQNDEFFYIQEEQRILEPYLHANIPQWLFEETLLPYFNISLEEFRRRCLFDSANGSYPWQEVYCGNVIYYPCVEPEVTDYKVNDDGTFTLSVNVRCNSYKTDRLFSHEVVIRPLDNDTYQYLSNKITYIGEQPLPVYMPRIPLQREKS